MFKRVLAKFICLVFSELPQLRTVTSMDLGCDPRGYSRAGSDTMVWYCVILAGRLSAELNKMREVNSLTQLCLISYLIVIWKIIQQFYFHAICVEFIRPHRMKRFHWFSVAFTVIAKSIHKILKILLFQGWELSSNYTTDILWKIITLFNSKSWFIYDGLIQILLRIWNSDFIKIKAIKFMCSLMIHNFFTFSEWCEWIKK